MEEDAFDDANQLLDEVAHYKKRSQIYACMFIVRVHVHTYHKLSDTNCVQVYIHMYTSNYDQITVDPCIHVHVYVVHVHCTCTLYM